MKLYEPVGNISAVNNDRQPEEKQYKKKSSEKTKFVVVEVMDKPTPTQQTLSESSKRIDSLFTELLNDQLRDKL